MAGTIFSTGTIQPCSDMAITGKQSLGTLLIQAGKIDQGQLQKALQIQKEKDVYIGQIFKELGYLGERELNRYIATS